MRPGYVHFVGCPCSYLGNYSQVFHSETNTAKDLLKRFPSQLGTAKTKISMIFPEMKSMFLFQQFQPAILKSQAENVLISQRNSRLMFFDTMFFGVRLYCNQVNFLTAFSSLNKQNCNTAFSSSSSSFHCSVIRSVLAALRSYSEWQEFFSSHHSLYGELRIIDCLSDDCFRIVLYEQPHRSRSVRVSVDSFYP